MKKFALVTLVVMFSMPLLAHPGHGSELPLFHSMEHGLWLVAGVAVIAVLWSVCRRNERSVAVEKTQTRNDDR